jgi:hypothetical protein
MLPKKTSEHGRDDTYSQEETTMVRTGKQQKQLCCLEEFDLFQTVNGNSGEACGGVDEEEKGNELEEIHQEDNVRCAIYYNTVQCEPQWVYTTKHWCIIKYISKGMIVLVTKKQML